MMFTSTLLALTLCLPFVSSIQYPRDSALSPSDKGVVNSDAYWLLEGQAESRDEFATFQDLLQMERHLALSFSMSYAPATKPAYSPVYSPVYRQTFRPTYAPTNMPSDSMVPSNTPSLSPSTTLMPSFRPSISTVPSVSTQPSVSSQPSQSDTPSSGPSDSPAPSESGTALPSSSTIPGLYECSDQGVVLSTDRNATTTMISLSVGYAAQFNGTEISDSVLDALEAALLKAAIAAAMDCNVTRRRLTTFPPDSEVYRRELMAATDTLGPCNATTNVDSCLVMETDLTFEVNGEVNPQFAAYSSYLAMRNGMDDDSLADEIDGIEKLTYLAPLPLDPPSDTSQPLDVDNANGSGTKGRSWAIGAGVVMSTCGVLALAGYYYNRRNKRALSTDEDYMSEKAAVTSCYSDEQGDWIGDA